MPAEAGITASYTHNADGSYSFNADSGPDDPKFKAAQQACASDLPDRMKKKSVSQAELDMRIKIAACMRRQGVDVKDPTADDPGLRISGAESDTGKVQAIKASCEKEVKGASPSH